MIFFSPSPSRNSSNLVASLVRLISSRFFSEAKALEENSTPRGHYRVWGFSSRDETFDTKLVIQELRLVLTRYRKSDKMMVCMCAYGVGETRGTKNFKALSYCSLPALVSCWK